MNQEKKADLPEEEKDLTDLEIARLTWDRFNKAIDSHDTWSNDAKKFEDFFAGEQWDEDDLQKLRAQGRPALTINLIKPAVMAILGEQQGTRAEVTYKPRNSLADQDTATILSQLAQYVDNDVKYGVIESQAFSDACITDRGFIDIRIGFDKNINGDITMSADNPRHIVLDPDTRELHPDSWPGVFETYWSSLDRIEAMYGKEKAESVRSGAGMDLEYISEAQSIRWADDRIARFGSASGPDAYDTDGNERYIEGIRVIEHQFYVTKKAWVFVDPVTGDIVDPRCDLSFDELKPIARQRGLRLVEMPRKRVRWHVVARNVVLYKGWSPYPFITKVPVFPFFRRGRPIGIVRDLISPQEQLNKIESQELHVINTTANSGWIYEDGSLLNMEDHEFAEKGAETGLVLKVRRGAGFTPQKIQPNQIPSALANKASKNVEYLRFISMVNDAMLGFSSPEVSGVVVNAKKQSAVTAFTPAFQNLAFARGVIAERVLWMIQNFYTAPRLVRITDYSKAERPEVEVAINVPDPMEGVLNNVTMGRYDVVVSTAPARDTHEESQFAQMVEMRNANIFIPDDEIVKRSNLTEKFPLAERIAQMQGSGTPSEEELQMQQMMMQFQVAQMEIEVARGQAEVANLQAQAQLNMAKAEQLRAEAGAGGDGGANDALIKAAIERERIAADLQKNREKIEAQLAGIQMQIQAKKDIANMQVGVKQQGMLHQSAIKRAEEANKYEDLSRKERHDLAVLAYKNQLEQQRLKATAKKQPTKPKRA